jgi:hypothetical protein
MNELSRPRFPERKFPVQGADRAREGEKGFLLNSVLALR